MSKQIITASYSGEIDLDGNIIACAVLDNPEHLRVLSQTEIVKALGKGQGGSKRGEAKWPRWISAKNITPYISIDLERAILDPIIYKAPNGSTAHGIPAKFLPEICSVWLKARDKGELTESQLETAHRADMLIRGLALVGIIALVDEATGFQEVRDKEELKTFLKKFLLEDSTKYVDAYPDEFFEMIFKMKGLTWSKANKGKNPQYFGHYINNYVYSRLGPEILYALRKLNPKKTTGSRKTKHYNYTTADYGFPKLKEHLSILIAFAKAANYNWNNWVRMIERAFPKYSQDGTTAPELPFNEDV